MLSSRAKAASRSRDLARRDRPLPAIVVRNAKQAPYHPSVIKAYENGKIEAFLFRGRLRRGLNKIENALMRFLERKSI